MNKNKYDKAVTRIAFAKGQNRITDAEVIISLENEIDYYRNKINLLENVREENRNVIKNYDAMIKELKETIKRMINGEDIFTFKTMNEIRNIFELEPIQNITTKTNKYIYGLDMSKDIDYTTITYYQDGKPIKEETIQYK